MRSLRIWSNGKMFNPGWFPPGHIHSKSCNRWPINRRNTASSSTVAMMMPAILMSQGRVAMASTVPAAGGRSVSVRP